MFEDLYDICYNLYILWLLALIFMV